MARLDAWRERQTHRQLASTSADSSWCVPERISGFTGELEGLLAELLALEIVSTGLPSEPALCVQRAVIQDVATARLLWRRKELRAGGYAIEDLYADRLMTL
jgi:hypothetical protein